MSAAARGNPVVACCSGSSARRPRASHPTLTGPLTNTASTTAVQASSLAPRRSIMCNTPAHSRAAGGGRYGSKEAPSRRHISLWAGGGRDQQTSPPEGTGNGGNSSEGDAALLRRQDREEEVLAALSAVVEPCTGKGVVALGLVQDLQLVDGEALSAGCRGRLLASSPAPHLCWFETAKASRLTIDAGRRTCAFAVLLCSIECVALAAGKTPACACNALCSCVSPWATA